jgi:protoporphyrinogen/coproporphyrinogen III oxidase
MRQTQINLLGLTPAILTTSRNSPAAKRRYLHIPPTKGLVAVPTSILGFLTSPLNYFILPILLEALRPPNRPLASKPNGEALQPVEDESVDSFLTRRFGPGIARVFGSSLVHGIYASDSRQTSMRAAFGRVWKAEEKDGSVVRSLLREAFFSVGKGSSENGYELGGVEEKLKGVSVFSFKDGIAMLPRAMEDWFKRRQNVRIRTAVGAHSLDLNPFTKSFEVRVLRNPS